MKGRAIWHSKGFRIRDHPTRSWKFNVIGEIPVCVCAHQVNPGMNCIQGCRGEQEQEPESPEN
jgi:hypothetical protein